MITPAPVAPTPESYSDNRIFEPPPEPANIEPLIPTGKGLLVDLFA